MSRVLATADACRWPLPLLSAVVLRAERLAVAVEVPEQADFGAVVNLFADQGREDLMAGPPFAPVGLAEGIQTGVCQLCHGTRDPRCSEGRFAQRVSLAIRR